MAHDAQGDALLSVAAAVGGALVGARPPPEAAAIAAQLLPGCCYLALALCSRHPGPGSPEGGQMVLLSGNVLAPQPHTPEPTGTRGVAACGVHALRSCLAGDAILTGRPRSCTIRGGGARPQAWTDAAAAAEQSGAGAFLCLPFKVPLLADGPAGSSSSGGSAGCVRATLAAALLLGTPAHGSAPPPQQQPQAGVEQQQPPQAGVEQQQPRQAAPQPPPPVCSVQRRMRGLLRVAAALVRHAQPQLAAAAEALAVLDAAPPLAAQPGGSERGSDSGSESESGSGSDGGAASGGGDAAALQGGRQRTAAPATPQVASPACPCGPAPLWSDPSSGSSASLAAASSTPDRPAEPPVAADPADAPAPQQQQQQPWPPPASAGGAEDGRPFPLRSLLRALLRSALPPRDPLRVDWLLRFPEPAAPAGAAAAGPPPERLGPPLPPLEAEFRQYHGRLMADKVDAAGALILLSILILLAKQPGAAVTAAHPLFAAMAATLALPLAALAPGPLRAWYVPRREQVVQLFFVLALLVQQASANFIHLPVAQRSQARFVNAGFAWLAVDGLLLQMRFCRQLPTLLACFILNLGAVPEVCRAYHPAMPPRRCHGAAVLRGLLFLAVPLAVIRALELRVRAAWLRRRADEAAEQQARPARRARLLRRRTPPPR